MPCCSTCDATSRPFSTYFEEDFEALRSRLVNAVLNVESLARRVSRCDLSHCRGMCCYDGIYLTESGASGLQRLRERETAFFRKLGLELPEVVVQEGRFRGEHLGVKTAVRPFPFRAMVPGYPIHFENTACVFMCDDGRCSLQVLGEARGLHQWHFKPFGCWLHPLTTRFGGRPDVIGLVDETTDPFSHEDYPGYVSETFCGRTCDTNDAAYLVLEDELEVLEFIAMRSLPPADDTNARH